MREQVLQHSSPSQATHQPRLAGGQAGAAGFGRGESDCWLSASAAAGVVLVIHGRVCSV